MPERKRDPEKAKRAAAHPKRPGKECNADAGTFHPVVDRSRCEGKRDCEAVCPYDVFEVRTIDGVDFERLSFFAKLKVRAHGKLSAYTPRSDACQACGLCVVSCPEKAISLVENAQ